MAGALGMSEADLWNTSPRVLVWMYSGFVESQESQIRSIWEAARFQAVTIANSNGAKIKQLSSLTKFPWEKNISKLTKEDIQRLRTLDKRFNGIKRS